MGQVFAAKRTSDGAAFAIKCMVGGESTKAFRDRFAREATLLASLSHPGIVRFVEWVQDGEEDYIVMELVEGETLSSLRPIPHADAVSIGIDICDALIYAHGEGIIHRDIKPSNILVTPDGRAKVVDFGVARPILSASGHTLTSTNAVVGTPFFTAPEVAMGGSVGPLLDVYSLGVLLYNAVTGEYPIGNYDPLAEPLNTVVRKATAYKAEKRYQDIASLRVDLVALRSGDELSELHQVPPQVGATRSPRAKLLWALSATALFLVGAFGISQMRTTERSASLADAALKKPEIAAREVATKIDAALHDIADAAPLASTEMSRTGKQLKRGRPKSNRDTSATVDGSVNTDTNEPPESKAGATLVIHVRPWGEVHIDGQFFGRVEPPLGRRFTLTKGRHHITVRNTITGNEQERYVTIGSETTQTIRIDLRKE